MQSLHSGKVEAPPNLHIQIVILLQELVLIYDTGTSGIGIMCILLHW